MYFVYLDASLLRDRFKLFHLSSVVIIALFSLLGCLHVERTKELYKDLLSVFDKLILPTHASCHVQYTIFYLCSFRLVSTPYTVSVL